MCEKKPGPRCNDGCKVRDKKLSAYKKASSYEKSSYEYLNAALELVEAQSIYDSTPKGISELEAKFFLEPTNLIAKRLLIARTTRRMQYAALEEHKNNRQLIISELVAKVYPYYSAEEIHTIIDGARENYEKVIISTNATKLTSNAGNLEELEESIFKRDEKLYERFIDRLEASKANPEALSKLKEIQSPYNYIIDIYSSVGSAIHKADKQMEGLLKNISVIQDTDASTAKKYFSFYKQEFIEKYKHLTKEDQPTPPREWIEGFLQGNGIARNDDTMLIPRVPEVQYAIYKLMIDSSAIPDYEKKASKLTFIDSNNGTILIKETTRTGKTIYSETTNPAQLIEYIEKNKINNTFVSSSKELSKLVRERNIPMLLISDITKMMFDLPSHAEQNLHKFFGTQGSQELYSSIKRKALKTWNTKPSRVNAKK